MPGDRSSDDPSEPDTFNLGAGSRPIVVGVDGSNESQRGLAFAAELATVLGVELIVVHGYGGIRWLDGWRPEDGDRCIKIEQSMKHEWCEPLLQRDELAWRSECVYDNAVDAMIRTADAVGAGLIVVGSHGAGSSSEPLLGSTSQRIVRNSHLPVVVVPPGNNHPHQRSGAGAMSHAVADAPG